MFSQIPPVSKLCDIETIEQVALTDRVPFNNAYALLRYSADKFADRVALRFTPNGRAADQPCELTYRNTTQAANLFNGLGLDVQDTISYTLPNIPQTHYCIWGGEAAGIVSAINSFLEANTIANILNETECKILVTTAGGEIWQKIQHIIEQIPNLQYILQVDLSQFDQIENVSPISMSPSSSTDRITVLGFDDELKRQPTDQLNFDRVIKGDEIAAYFHTGGTTGHPKIAMHTHFNQVSNAWAVSALCIDNNQKRHHCRNRNARLTIRHRSCVG
jgi:fatty-acyl-CoA synthase